MLENITKKIFGTPNERYLKNTEEAIELIIKAKTNFSFGFYLFLYFKQF